MYASTRTAGIPHQDILSIWGNPYIGVVTKWYGLGSKRWDVIEKEYPGVWSVAYNIDKVKSDFRNVLFKTTPEVRQFVNDFAIPIATMRTGAPSRLRQVAEKISEYLFEIADGFNRAMIPGYSAYADGGSVEEIVTSAGSDLILTYCGGKAIKLSYQGLKYAGAKFSSVLKPKTTKITWGLWEDLPKTTYKGRTYAKIGKYYYSRHAVDYMPPANVRIKLGIPEEQELRCIPSMAVEEAIKYGKKTKVFENGEWRRMHVLDKVKVITSMDDKVVITLRKERVKK